MLDDPAHGAQPDHFESNADGGEDAEGAPLFGSLAEDVSALFEDGKTYVDAEVAYQKSRIKFSGHQAKRGFAFSLGALAFLHLALVGLVVGLIIALAPFLTAFGSLAVVVGALLVIGIVLAKLASRHFNAMGAPFERDDDGGN